RTNLGLPNYSPVCGHGQQSHLGHGEPEGTQRVVIRFCDNPRGKSKARGDATAHYLRGQSFRPVCNHTAPSRGTLSVYPDILPLSTPGAGTTRGLMPESGQPCLFDSVLLFSSCPYRWVDGAIVPK